MPAPASGTARERTAPLTARPGSSRPPITRQAMPSGLADERTERVESEGDSEPDSHERQPAPSVVRYPPVRRARRARHRPLPAHRAGPTRDRAGSRPAARRRSWQPSRRRRRPATRAGDSLTADLRVPGGAACAIASPRATRARTRLHPDRGRVARLGQVHPRARRRDTRLQEHGEPRARCRRRPPHPRPPLASRHHLALLDGESTLRVEHRTTDTASRRTPSEPRSTWSTVPMALADLTCERAIVEPGECAERLQPRRHVREAVGVEGARPAVVTGVERRQQVTHLFAATFADHEPVGPHPQRFAHQARRARWRPRPRDSPAAPRAARDGDARCCSSATSSIVTMRSLCAAPREQRREERGLARPGTAGHQDVRATRHLAAQELAHPRGVEHAALARARPASAARGAARGSRSLYPSPRSAAGRRACGCRPSTRTSTQGVAVVDVASTEPDERHRERSHVFFGCAPLPAPAAPGPRSTKSPSAPLMKRSVTSGSSRYADERIPTGCRGPTTGSDAASPARRGWATNDCEHALTLEGPSHREAVARRSVDEAHVRSAVEEAKRRRERRAASHGGNGMPPQATPHFGGDSGVAMPESNVRPDKIIRESDAGVQTISAMVIRYISRRGRAPTREASPTIGGSAYRASLGRFRLNSTGARIAASDPHARKGARRP